MKVKIIAGRLTAEAESAEDMKALLAYAGTATLAAPRAKGARTGKKQKKVCAICGKRVKYMYEHTTRQHPQTVEEETTSV